MTHVNKSKDGRIGPQPKSLAPEPEPTPETVTVAPSMKMKRTELVELAEAKSIETKGLTKTQLIEALEE